MHWMSLPLWSVSLGLGVGCSNDNASSAGSRADDPKPAAVVATPPKPASKLPAERPTPFSATYQIDAEGERIDTITLAASPARQASQRGRRNVSVAYDAPEETLDHVYQTLRTQACDQVETQVQRGSDRGGTILQLRFGSNRHVVNDKGLFFPKPEWIEAYKACANAMDASFPAPQDQAVAQLELRFAEKLSRAVRVNADLGPDYRGLVWDDDERVATLAVAKRRPVELVVGSGKLETRSLVDLARHGGVTIELLDHPDRDSELRVERIEQPAAQVGGEVAVGVDARSQRTPRPSASTAAAEPQKPPAPPSTAPPDASE